jgi:hypothetical protein
MKTNRFYPLLCGLVAVPMLAVVSRAADEPSKASQFVRPGDIEQMLRIKTDASSLGKNLAAAKTAREKAAAPSAPSDLVANGRFRETQFYAYALYSPEECAQIRQKDPVVHCNAWLQFYADGGAILRITDILTRGRYSIEGDQVTIDFDSSCELGKKATLTMSPDRGSMNDQKHGMVWKIQPKPKVDPD